MSWVARSLVLAGEVNGDNQLGMTKIPVAQRHHRRSPEMTC